MSRPAISDDDYGRVFGKVFVHKTSYSVKAYQVVGRTKCYVRALPVPLKHTYDNPSGTGSHTIDWENVEKPPAGSNCKEGDLFSLETTTATKPEQRYVLARVRDNVWAYQVDDGDGKSFATVEY